MLIGLVGGKKLCGRFPSRDLTDALRRFRMHLLVNVARARVVIAALRWSPPWMSIEADLLACDHQWLGTAAGYHKQKGGKVASNPKQSPRPPADWDCLRPTTTSSGLP
jgi:hypothetical protein